MARKRKPIQNIPEAFIQEVDEIPADEQIRLIEQSGVLRIPTQDDEKLPAEEEEQPSLVNEIFDCIILLIPFSCLYVGMDMYVVAPRYPHGTLTLLHQNDQATICTTPYCERGIWSIR